jgi:hypothetical protein
MHLTLFLVTKFFLLELKVIEAIWDLLDIIIAIAGTMFTTLCCAIVWFDGGVH